jgi:thioesterase domain-containing protein
MKGSDSMPDAPERSEVRRVLLEKYLRGDRLQVAGTTSDITQGIRAKVDSARESVVAIQKDGTKRPFFFLHGDWIRGAYWCFPLARALGSDQPLYALEPYSFDGLAVPPAFEAMAAAHLKSLRAVQPEGPYLLGGFCNGALLAYEMARQLHAEGQMVDLLVLMDPMGLVYPVEHRLAHAVLSRTGSLVGLGEDKQLNGYILLRHIYHYLRLSHYRRSEDARPWGADKRFERGSGDGKVGFALLSFDAIFPPVEALRRDYSAVYDWAAMSYLPQSLYPGKITFFWDSQEPWRRKGWREAAETNETEVHIIPGTQMESRTKYLHVLAEHLSACLSKVQSGAK